MVTLCRTVRRLTPEDRDLERVRIASAYRNCAPQWCTKTRTHQLYLPPMISVSLALDAASIFRMWAHVLIHIYGLSNFAWKPASKLAFLYIFWIAQIQFRPFLSMAVFLIPIFSPLLAEPKYRFAIA